MSDATHRDLKRHLATFRLSSFRPGQAEVISAVLAGEDCLCVMPTGGGKSLCYQLPATVLDGLTLVVSPLIALMKDQVDQLQVLDLPVTFINSTLPMAEQYTRLERMAAGAYRLVYVVPERFRSGRFLDAVRAVGLKLLAVDEAHCISEWGHDFRPDYARLGYFRRMLGNPVTIALTATATDQVRRDIIEQLDLREPQTFITGFERPNLFYEVQSPGSERQKADLLVRFLDKTPGSGIIYASTRKRTEEVAAVVTQQTRRRTCVYHAGLLPDQRRTTQESFMEGRFEIVVATNAFGMGIDKADVRFVVHYNLPGTLEAYYQEAGRAGRDGEPSRCLLLYHASDRYIQEYFIESAYPAHEHVAQVYNYLRSLDDDPIELTQEEVKGRLNLPIGNDGVGNCEQLLEGAGVLERLVASRNLAIVRLDSDLPTLVDLLPKQAKVRRRVLQAIERLVGARRNELIHFNPRDLAETTELDQISISNALRELNRLEAFTYVPRFRGRAIRMIDRETPFEELQIDFEALQRRKAAEYEKLNRVVRFALSGECRQRGILRYFGEHDAQPCGHCDNCRRSGHDPSQQHAAAATTDEKVLEAVRMVLSGVARAVARLPCGKNLIAQMLCGSGSAKVAKLGLNQLSTFGLLSRLKQTEVATLIDGLIAVGYLQQVDLERFRPVVQLTDLGAEVMRGQTEMEVALPIPAELLRRIRGEVPYPVAAESPSDAWPDELPEADPEVLAALKQWRREQAAEAGLPPGYVLTNAMLDLLARRRPDSPKTLLAIKGIGPDKLSRFGEELLQIVARGADSADRSCSGTRIGETPPFQGAVSGCSDEGTDGTREPPQAARQPLPVEPPDLARSESVRKEAPPLAASDGEATGVRPSHYWTWRVLSAGFSLDECMAIRGVPGEVVLDHVLQAADAGWKVDARWCLTAELLSAMEAVVGQESPAQIRPLLTHLPEGTRYEEVALFLKCRHDGSGE